jgi:hypothetical protein
MADIRDTWQAFYATLVGELGTVVGTPLQRLPSRHFLPALVDVYRNAEDIV